MAGSGAVLVCDAVQAPLAMDIDVAELPIGALTLSAHKLYGPKGIGALYLRRVLCQAVEPLIYGGGQQNGLRSGTLPTPLCVGFGAAAELAASEDRHAERASIAALRDDSKAQLRRSIAPFCSMVAVRGVILGTRTSVSECAMRDICYQ